MADRIIKQVFARRPWVPTPVWANIGDTLVLRARGTWFDAIIPCSADGYHAPLFYALNRPPRIPDGDRYFRLMGRLFDGAMPSSDEPAVTFPIGTHAEFEVKASGRLFVFANDRSGYYWNNLGSIDLSIEIERRE